MQTMKLEAGRIVSGGMGGFLNPPTHPEHTLSVEIDLRRRKENRGSMSLSAAASCEWLEGAARGAAKRVLREWERPAIDSAEVRAWIKSTLAYFAGCYKGEAGATEWHADKLRINPKADPLLNADLHAGVNLVRKYYPEYKPVADDFTGKWGA